MSASIESSAKRISGKVLQRLRSGSGLVQEEMADRLGKARSSLAGWEAGRGGLNLENLLAFLDELGVTMEEFGRHFDRLRAEAGGRENPAPMTTAPMTPTRKDLRMDLRGEAAPGSPIVLQASQALVMLFPEGAEAAATQRSGDALQPWVQELFKRAERLFPGPEEAPERSRTTETGREAAGSSNR